MTSERGCNLAIWRHSSEPIEPPAPVTRTRRPTAAPPAPHSLLLHRPPPQQPLDRDVADPPSRDRPPRHGRRTVTVRAAVMPRASVIDRAATADGSGEGRGVTLVLSVVVHRTAAVDRGTAVNRRVTLS